MPNPPKLFLRFFRWFCHPTLRASIEGDLVELFEERVRQIGKRKADRKFRRDVLLLFRKDIIRPVSGTYRLNYYGVLKHNLRVSLRSFSRYKTSFFINLLGLTGGLLTALFIFLWADREFQVDKFHEDGDQIFRLVSDNGGSETLLNSSIVFSRQLEESIPEIERMVYSSWSQLESTLIANEEVFTTTGEFGSEEFFELFSYPLIHGNKRAVLEKPNAILLSESTAKKIFNSVDVVGKTLEWRWFRFVENVVVTGVYKDLPTTSSSQFDYVLSFNLFERNFQERIDRGNRLGRTYVKLHEGAEVERVNQKIREFVAEEYPDSELRPAILISYADYYLNNIYENGEQAGGRIGLVRLFMVIGVLILVIACVNFMNLSTARAALRTKEIGVRKVMGAQRVSLIQQYLTESCLISLFAGIAAIAFLIILIPLFQKLTGEQLEVVLGFRLVAAFFGIVLITGLLSGSYPAFYLSNFKPLRVLKGQLVGPPSEQWFRKGLVVLQFSISLILIISVMVVYEQMQFIQSKSLGYTKDYILNFGTNNMNRQKQQAFLSEARKIDGVEKASGIIHALFGGQIATSNVSWRGKDPDQTTWIEWGYVDYDMLELLEIEMKQGRTFSREFGDERTKLIINQATQELMDLENPVGEKFTIGETDYEIIGVTANFHYQSLHEEIKPTFFRLSSGYSMKLAVRIDPEKIQATISQIDELYGKFNPGFPFEYSFHDQDQQGMYLREQKMAALSKYAAGLAILISCLGLFGLVSFVSDRKAKEMGIRKVLGASSRSLVVVLSKDFLVPLTVSIVLGLLVSSYVMELWLNEFSYRIKLEWWVFAASVGTLILLAIGTASTQVFKALTKNPVNALKDE